MLQLNKTYLGDCVDIMKKIDDKSIDVVLCDIPYAINHDNWDVIHNNTNSALGGTSPAMTGKFKRRGKPINGWNEADKKIGIEYYNWCLDWSKQIFRITKEGSPILIFSSRRYQHRVSTAMEDAGMLIRDILIWKKNRCHTKTQKINNILHKRGIYDNIYDNYRIGNLPPIYEPIIWATKPYKKTLTDCILQNGVGGLNCKDGIPTNIFECGVVKNNIHPTEKPIPLLEKLIELFTIKKDSVILDFCAGSGTTGLAAKNLGRNYIMIEKDEKYFDIIKQRLEE